jgi:hypothetical protein
MVQPDFCRSDGHASCTDLLRLDATSVIPPRAVSFLLGASARVLRRKPSNHPRVAYSICVPYNFLGRCLDSVNISLLHIQLPPSLLVQALCRPPPLPVRRYGTSLFNLHLVIDHCLRAPHLHITSQETCCTTHSRHC